MAMVAIAFFPLVIYVVRLAIDERQATTARQRENALRLLDVAVAEHRDVTRSGLELLRHLPGMADIASGDQVTCSRALRQLLFSHANFTSAIRITPDFRIDCSAITPADTLSDFVRELAVMRRDSANRPVSGWIRYGPLGQPLATILEPVRDNTGAPRYYLAIEAELDWFNRLASGIPKEPGAMVAIVDSTGFIIARQPDGERFAGARYPPNGPMLEMIEQDSGFVEGVGLDGRARLYSFRTLTADNSAQVLLMVGIPTRLLYAEANRRALTYVGLLLVVLFLTGFMSWIAADYFVMRDVNALLGATERLSDGDLSARIPSPSMSGELNDLSRRFNELARRLEERRREFVLLGDSTPDAIARISRDLEIEWANAALRTRLGASVDDIVGCRIDELDLEPSLIASASQQIREVFTTGKPREVELFVPSREGDSWVDLRVSPERNAAGEISHAMVIARDVTARRELASHLAEAERLDSIGKLAGHIAHDFNNLLTAIIGNAEIALRQLEPHDRATADVEKIMDVARRASSLTRQLLSFARRQSTTARVLDVKAFIEEVTPLLRRVCGDQVTPITNIDPSTPHVRFDPTQLEQVLVNLAANARDAMPSGGTLRIATRLREVGTAETGADGRKAGRYLELTVSDTGIGMSAEVRQRIFEPFFSTKHGKGGTGLGLAVAYGAVRQNAGTIEVESVENQGATFRILVPASTSAPERTDTPQRAPDAPRGRETILLAEDQDDVRHTIGRLLRSHGYTVIETADGDEVLKKLERRELPPFQLLITDLVMPRVGGEQLVTALRPTYPEVPVLVISGFDQQGSLRRMFERREATAFLEKPFEGQPMLKLVRELLDANAKHSRTAQKAGAVS